MFDSLTLLERIYVITAAITAVESFCLSFFVLRRNVHNKLNQSYAIFGLCVGLWSLFLVLCHLTIDLNQALFWNRLLHFCSVYIAISFYWFICNLLELKNKPILVIGVLLSLLIGSLCFSSLLVQEMGPKYDFRLWPIVGKLYPLYLLYFSFYSYGALYFVFENYQKAKGLKREQLKFIFIGLSIGFIGGSTNFAYSTNIPIPPLGNFFVFLYVLILAYAIIRYRLMDIRVVVSNAAIFVVVYVSLFILPFYLMKYNRPWISLYSMAVMASVAPYIYNKVRKKAENEILREEKAYQEVLLAASTTLTNITSVDEIIKSAIAIFSKTIGVKCAAFYLIDGQKYVLKGFVGASGLFASYIEDWSPLVSYVNCFGLFFMEELRHKNINDGSAIYADHKWSYDKPVCLGIPVKQNTHLLGVIFLGDKNNGKIYSEHDINVLRVVSNQIALAIEYAVLFENEEFRLRQEEKQARLEFLDQIVATMSHEIRTPNAVIANEAALCSLIVKKHMNGQSDPVLIKVEKTLDTIIKFSGKIGELIQLVLNYSKDHEFKVHPVAIRTVWEDIKIFSKATLKNSPDVVFQSEIEEFLPDVLADSLRVEMIINNFLTNAQHAVKGMKQGEKKEIRFRAFRKDAEHVRLEVVDNGIGVKPEVLSQLFTTIKTTKGVEGNGLGLWQSRRICERMGARLGLSSDGDGKGSCAWIELRVA